MSTISAAPLFAPAANTPPMPDAVLASWVDREVADYCWPRLCKAERRRIRRRLEHSDTIIFRITRPDPEGREQAEWAIVPADKEWTYSGYIVKLFDPEGDRLRSEEHTSELQSH